MKEALDWVGAWKVKTLRNENQFRKRQTRPGHHIKINVAERIAGGGGQIFEIPGCLREARDPAHQPAPQHHLPPFP